MIGAASASAMARSTSAGNRFRLCVPTMTSIMARALEQRFRLLLRDTASHGDNRSASGLFARLTNFAEPCVQLLLRALAHAARVDDNHVRILRIRRRFVARLLQEARHALGVMNVHLAAVGFNEIFHLCPLPSVAPLALSTFACVSLSSFDFVSLSPNNSRAAAARAASVGAAPPIIRASSSMRSD